MQNLIKILILLLVMTLSVSCKSLDYLDSDLDLSSPQIGQKVVLKCGSVFWALDYDIDELLSKAYTDLDRELRSLSMLMQTNQSITIKITYFRYVRNIDSVVPVGDYSQVIRNYFVNNGISSERVEATWQIKSLKVGKYHRLSGKKKCRFNRGEVVITNMD